MADKYQNDLMHLQNELLGDLKRVENKIEAKIKKVNQSVEEQKEELEKKMNYLENAYTVLLQRTNNIKTNDNSKEQEILSKIEILNKKIEDHSFRLENKYNSLKTEFKDNNYKFDKIISDNFQIPGLIGYRAPFLNFREFIDNLNKRLNDSIKAKDQQALDLKKYKEKMDNTLNTNKNQFSMLENRINSKSELQIKDLEKRFNERITIIEERINTMRMENGKYSYDLLAQCNDLTDKCNRIDDILKSTLDEYNDEFAKYKNTFKNMNEKLNKFEEKYKLFEERLKIINEQFVNNKNNSNYISLENKIKELERICLSMKANNYFASFEEKKNKSNYIENIENNVLSRLNKIEPNIEEDEKSSFFTNRHTKKLEGNITKNEQQNISERNYQKRNDLYFSEEKEEQLKQNDELYNSGKLKNSKLLKDILDSANRTSKTRDSPNRIRSGKIFSQYPFISYDRKGNNEDIIKQLGRNKINYFAKEKIKSNDTIYRSGEKRGIINLMSKYKTVNEFRKKQMENDSNDKIVGSNHKYRYLDKKIDILGKVMVESFNKIILQMNFFKNNNINKSDLKEIKSKDNTGQNENNDKNYKNTGREPRIKINFPQPLKNSNSLYLKENLNIKSKYK